MDLLHLDDGTEFNVLFCEPGEILGHGERTLEIGVVLDDSTTPLDVENAFKAHASRIEIGGVGLAEDGETEIPFEAWQVYEGYTKIKTYLVDRNFVYNIDQTCELVRMVMQEPGMEEMLTAITSAIGRGVKPMSNIADALEALIRFAQSQLTEQTKTNEDKTQAIACKGLFQTWTPGIYSVGDIRLDPETGTPKECIQAHDSITNPDWTIDTATLWKPYHSRDAKWALPWEAPTGAHDIYKAGEYMVYTDGKTYKCLSDTNYSPTDYAQAWQVVETE